MTETMYTLAMITKAGVPAYKVAVGVSSYGRSFGMTSADCTGPECTFTGSSTESTAAQGECTMTGGYISNAEILDFVNANVSVKTWYDKASDSNYLVYNKTSWVAYMTDGVKTSRKSKYAGLNFAGTVDWAVDLTHWGDSDGNPDGGDSCTDTEDGTDCDEGDPQHPWVPCDEDVTGSLDDLSDATMAGWPTNCAAQYTLEAMSNLLSEAHQNFTDLMDDGYDDKFKVYSKSVAASADKQVHDFLLAQGTTTSRASSPSSRCAAASARPTRTATATATTASSPGHATRTTRKGATTTRRTTGTSSRHGPTPPSLVRPTTASAGTGRTTPTSRMCTGPCRTTRRMPSTPTY